MAPDFKTIADFRRDNGPGIRNVCSQFVVVCRKLKLLADGVVAVDGSKFKAVNNRYRNFTPHKLEQRMKQIQESIDRYLQALDTADRTQPNDLPAKTAQIKDKVTKLRRHMRHLREVEKELQQQPDKQLSLTDPDARSMATSGRGTGVVGYNVQAAVDTQHHLIVAHDVINVGHDRDALSSMAKKAQEALGRKGIGVLADRGYYKGQEIAECEKAGVNTCVPKPMTSSSKAEGRFGKMDFIYIAKADEYRCPAGETLKRRSDVRGLRRVRGRGGLGVFRPILQDHRLWRQRLGAKQPAQLSHRGVDQGLPPHAPTPCHGNAQKSEQRGLPALSVAGVVHFSQGPCLADGAARQTRRAPERCGVTRQQLGVASHPGGGVAPALRQFNRQLR